MKVSDNEIIAAVWRRMVIATARGAISKYVGGTYGLAGDLMRGYGQDCSMVGRKSLGVPLSNGHLRRRLISLIDSGRLQWAICDCTFWIDCDRTTAMYQRATEWWISQGVPGGYCDVKKGMRTAPLDDFDELVKQLEDALMAEFGDYREA